jgi:hypothetical protein
MTDCLPEKDDNFGGASSHRAGYTANQLDWVERWARKGGTLAAGEGLILCLELDLLRALLIDHDTDHGRAA